MSYVKAAVGPNSRPGSAASTRQQKEFLRKVCSLGSEETYADRHVEARSEAGAGGVFFPCSHLSGGVQHAEPDRADRAHSAAQIPLESEDYALSIYPQLEKAVLPLIEHWREDLIQIDREFIDARPTTPFLHWTRETGTTLVFLPPIDD
jgi:hypothetical protein